MVEFRKKREISPAAWIALAVALCVVLFWVAARDRTSVPPTMDEALRSTSPPAYGTEPATAPKK
jgi:hypothetical protein